jgi:hypothetical protein
LPEALVNIIAACDEDLMKASLDKELPEGAQDAFRMVRDWVSEWSVFLKKSPGFVLPELPEYWNDLSLRFAYSLICRALGELNGRYGYFFDVKDQGLDYKKEAIPVSKTRDSTGFHTDSTASSYFPDLVGLLCLYPAAFGGDSLLTNAANLHHHLKDQHPEFIEVLSSGLLRDVITPGSIQDNQAILANKVPVFQEDESGFLFRYMRFWTEKAYEKTGTVPPAGLIESLDAVDDFFNHESNLLSFRMERGAILMISNRFLCHNRSAFFDAEEGKPARLLVRAWINFV